MDNDHGLTDWLLGSPLRFDVDGVPLQLRQPSASEYDDAVALQDQVSKVFRAQNPDLRDLPASDGWQALAAQLEVEAALSETPEPKRISLLNQSARIRKRTLLDELAHERALLARDRWLTARLLQDADGKPLCDTRTPAGLAAWDALPLRVKDAARPYVWAMLQAIETLPFSLAPRSSSITA